MNRRNHRRKNKDKNSAFQFLKRVKRPKMASQTKLRPQIAKSETNTRVPASYVVTVMLLVIIAVCAFVYHLNVRFEGVWLGYETSRARAERARLLVERRELRLELASLKAPSRIEAEAREKLGMKIPDHDQIIPVGKIQNTVMASGRVR
jgi:cell division protein FtsL